MRYLVFQGILEHRDVLIILEHCGEEECRKYRVQE
jgi:hypothetical protein